MNRHRAITEKIDRETTGLNGAIYVHADLDDAGQPVSFRFSHKGKDDSTLDRILTALGDSVTGILTHREVA